MPNFCKYCGKELPRDAQFCPSCGKRLQDDSSVLFTVDEPEDNSSKKRGKKGSLFLSCGIPVLLLAVALIAGAAVYVYNFYSERSNALLPKDPPPAEERKDTVKVSFEEEKPANPIADRERDEADLRRRVQNIYIDAFRMNPNADYAQRYCTASFNKLEREARRVDQMFIDCDYWIFAQDYDKPAVEQLKVISFSGDAAVVKVAVRPFYRGQEINIVTINLLKEDGAWLIDDFRCNGFSVKEAARRTIDEAQSRRERRLQEADSIIDKYLPRE